MNGLETSPTTFSRYEFKYVFSGRRREEIEEEVRHFMSYDGHIHPELNDSYYVRSMYFDSPSAVNYYEKTDGIRTRRKFRIRTYGIEPDPDLPIFLEEKGRYNQRTYKNRIAFNPEHLPIFSDPTKHDRLPGLYPDDALIERFVFDTIRRNLRPRVLVDYKRRPYVSEFDMNFRVTFDSELQAMPTETLFPGPDGGWRASDAGFTILEIKFHRRIPAWFHRTLQAYGMRVRSISKFCRGMEVCGLAKNLE